MLEIEQMSMLNKSKIPCEIILWNMMKTFQRKFHISLTRRDDSSEACDIKEGGRNSKDTKRVLHVQPNQ